MISNEFNFNEPVDITYMSSIFFAPSSFVPESGDLNELLASAFLGENLEQYIARVQALPGSNIFSTTTAASYEADSSFGSGGIGPQMAGIAAAAGAGAVLLILVGIVAMRRRTESEEADKCLGSDGHVTVGGETYEGSFSEDSDSHEDGLSQPSGNGNLSITSSCRSLSASSSADESCDEDNDAEDEDRSNEGKLDEVKL